MGKKKNFEVRTDCASEKIFACKYGVYVPGASLLRRSEPVIFLSKDIVLLVVMLSLVWS